MQDQITDLIVELDLDPGDPLPAEPELMRTLGVSRNSVREALKGLQALGIVDIRHGYGTYVGTAQVLSMAPGLLFHSRLAVRRENPGALRDIVEVRAMLESGLIRRSALELTAADLDRLQAELDALAADGAPGRADHDRRFHELLYEPLGNTLALQLIALFWGCTGSSNTRSASRARTTTRSSASTAGSWTRCAPATRAPPRTPSPSTSRTSPPAPTAGRRSRPDRRDSRAAAAAG